MTGKHTPAQAFDYRRVLEWAKTPNRKAAVLSFTQGADREVAYLVEALSAQAEPTEMREKLHDLGKRAHNIGQGREPDNDGTIFEKASHAISILIGDLLYMADRLNEGGRFRDTIKLGEDAISGLERATKPNEPTDAERKALEDVDKALAHRDTDHISPCSLMLIKRRLTSRQLPMDAIKNLREHQGQLDRDGIMVSISRQALDELLDYVEGK